VELRTATCGLLLSLLAAGTAVATPKETHKLGVEAIEAGRWEDAERFFREAIAEKPEEKVSKFFDTAYLPHFYLGVALSELGRCQEALDALTESDRQGQIQKSDHASELNQRRTRCQNDLRRIETAKREAEAVLGRADEAAAALKSLSSKPELAPLWNQGEPSFGSRQRSAEKKLAAARERFEAGGAGDELNRLDEAKSLADAALAELKATHTDARRRLGELNAATAAALEQLEVVEEGARELLRSVSDLAPYPRRLGSRVAAVDGLLTAVEESRSSAKPERLTELAAELTDAMGTLRRAAVRPPRELARAVETYLEGSYQDALALLDAAGLTANARARPYVCLIKAASHHGLWVLGGERDDALRDLAVEAITACAGNKTSDEPPSLPVSPKIFSPRFIEFYDATLQASARSAELEAPEDEPAAGDPAAGNGASGG
jgi:tetratricopeptide (TPR) repeat protein